MARRKRSKRKDETFAGWVWMLFGLAIGLSVAVAIYFRGPVASGPVVVSESAPAETAAVPDRDTPVAANQPQEELTEEEAR